MLWLGRVDAGCGGCEGSVELCLKFLPMTIDVGCAISSEA
jgi:hypothetical protein